MAGSLVKLYAHIMFHVKTTSVKMRPDDLPRIFSYIAGIVNNIGGVSIAVNGVADHVHLLVALPKTLSVAEFLRTIKSDSSKFIKSLDQTYYKFFSWQDGYGAYSVSASVLKKTQEYVMNQAEHHKRSSWEEECRKYFAAYGIQIDERYVFSD